MDDRRRVVITKSKALEMAKAILKELGEEK
jgi:hypothetical protein